MRSKIHFYNDSVQIEWNADYKLIKRDERVETQEYPVQINARQKCNFLTNSR